MFCTAGCARLNYTNDLVHWRARADLTDDKILPICDSTGWTGTILPGSFTNFLQSVSGNSPVWLCTRLYLTEKEREIPLAFDPGIVSGSYSVYLNGILLTRFERRSPDPFSFGRSVDLPAGLLLERNIILIKFINISDVPERSGIYGGIPIVVDSRHYRSNLSYGRSIKFAVIMLMGGVSVIFLITYLRHIKAFDYLFLGCFILCGAFYCFLREDLHTSFVMEDSAVFQRIENSLIFLIPVFYSHFILYFSARKLWNYVTAALDFVVLCAAIVALLPLTLSPGVIRYGLIAAAMSYFVYITIFLISQAMKKRKRSYRMMAKVLAVGMIAGFDGFNQAFNLFPDLIPVNLTLFAFFIVTIFVSVVLMSRYRHVLNELEKIKGPKAEYLG